MDRRQIAAVLTLKRLGIPLALDSFGRRLVVQKVLYLAQASGLDLGYFFSWYLRGPYCSDVSRDLFPAFDEINANSDPLSGWTLDQASDSKLNQLCGLVRQGETPQNEIDPSHVELLASVHFLALRRGLGVDPHVLTSEIQRLGKDFNQQQVQSALSKLRESNLL